MKNYFKQFKQKENVCFDHKNIDTKLLIHSDQNNKKKQNNNRKFMRNFFVWCLVTIENVCGAGLLVIIPQFVQKWTQTIRNSKRVWLFVLIISGKQKQNKETIVG